MPSRIEKKKTKQWEKQSKSSSYSTVESRLGRHSRQRARLLTWPQVSKTVGPFLSVPGQARLFKYDCFLRMSQRLQLKKEMVAFVQTGGRFFRHPTVFLSFKSRSEWWWKLDLEGAKIEIKIVEPVDDLFCRRCDGYTINPLPKWLFTNATTTKCTKPKYFDRSILWFVPSLLFPFYFRWAVSC